MHIVLRHLRPLLISLVALTLTAGMVMAAKPSDAGARHAPKAAETTETRSEERRVGKECRL